MHPDPSHKSIEYATQEEYWLIAKLYLFAEKYLDDAFANAMIDTFTEALDSPNPDAGFYYAPSGLVIAAVYARTMPTSPLRRLMAQTYVNANKNEWLDEEQRKGFAKCLEFLMDVLAGDPDDSLVQGRLYERREEFYRGVRKDGESANGDEKCVQGKKKDEFSPEQ
ncbi:uncharacterized protein RHO25_003390 [Cercospora beticola]|uniref:Uncharacterized protein n=1 Tax=Cercospora beticola TaxID=122368 RepID=A0ABZ0NGW2_CERBT|nr:hypothetical protein RHO25_003390 [Cercospora beticola]CAK1360057.1 unnamed protein product [Cercospora beticola]